LGQPNTSLAQAARELIVTDTETAAALAALLTDKLDVLKKVRARRSRMVRWPEQLFQAGHLSIPRPAISPLPPHPCHSRGHRPSPLRLRDAPGLRFTGDTAAGVRNTPSWPRSGPTSAFFSCIPTRTHGPTCVFWANLTPFSLGGAAARGRAAGRQAAQGAAEGRARH
jgi:hypothetical protein